MADQSLKPGGLLPARRALDDYLNVLLQESAARVPEESANVPCPPPAEARDSDRRVAAWAYPEFVVQLFTVGKLQLAVPLDKLQGVVAWNDALERQTDHRSGCLGSLSYQERTVWVIDTAALVLPPERRELMPSLQPDYILIVGNGSWGLACHSVGEVIRLAWDEVNWRRQRGRRPWLAGTALRRGCAVLDCDDFAEFFG